MFIGIKTEHRKRIKMTKDRYEMKRIKESI